MKNILVIVFIGLIGGCAVKGNDVSLNSIMESGLSYVGVMSSNDGPTQAKINTLLTLSEENGVVFNSNASEIETAIKSAIKNTEAAKSYCSYGVIRDFDVNELKNRDHVILEWRLDYFKPDKYLVSQITTESISNSLYDQWISIGKANYQNAGLWYRTEDLRHEKLNKLLRIESFLELVRNGSAFSRKIYTFGPTNYLILKYVVSPSNNVLNLPFSVFDFRKGVKDCYVVIWVDLKTNYISRGTILLQGQIHNRSINMEVRQVFTSFNEDIRIVQPRVLDQGDVFRVGSNAQHHK